MADYAYAGDADGGFEVTAGDQVASLAESVYVYDAFNRRVRKAVDSDGDGIYSPVTPGDEITRFVYGCTSHWQLLEEYDEIGGTSTLAKRHVYGGYIDELLTTRDYTGGIAVDRYFYQDDQFNVVTASGPSGSVAERYVYSDYGEVLVIDVAGTPIPASAINNRHLHAGLMLDGETGLVQYRHRYASPTIAKFVQPDPIGDWTDTLNFGNRAAMLGSGPMNRLDPLGLSTTSHRVPLELLIEHLVAKYGPIGRAPAHLASPSAMTDARAHRRSSSGARHRSQDIPACTDRGRNVRAGFACP